MGYVVTTLIDAKANGTLREEALKMADLLGFELNQMIDELGISWLFE